MRDRELWFTTTWFCPECDCEIDIKFKPERPAPACSNHDSPAFSDSGDPADIDYPDECPECGLELISHEDSIYAKVCEIDVNSYEPEDRYDDYEYR